MPEDQLFKTYCTITVERIKRPVAYDCSRHHLITRLIACLGVLLVALLAACGSQPHTMIIVAGSTSVQPFAEVLAEEYMHIHAGAVVDIQGGGSSAGIRAAESGTADIGMSSRSLKDAENNLWCVEIAKDGLAVIVNPANPIDNLSIEQVRQIYAASVKDWSQIGGNPAEIHVFAREEGSGTRSAFIDLVMGEARITPKSLIQDSNGAVRQLVADDPAAIGFISLGLVNEQVKALRLDGVAATNENIINNSYILARPFLFVANAEPTAEAKLFIDFTLSAEGQRILAAEGLVPIGGNP